MAVYDLFFSYRRLDLSAVRPVLDALRAAGLTVWIDERQIPDHEPITQLIREGIAASKVLVA